MMALKVFIRFVIVWGIALMSVVNTHASENLIFEHFNMENGLSQNTINSIIQDDYGFMWFGTKDGLNRFDGLTFKVYRHIPNDLTSLGSSYILSLCKDTDGVLWVGTDVGLYAYDTTNDNFHPLSDKAADGKSITERVNDINVDKNGDIWLTAGPQGVFKYSKAENRLYHYDLNDEC